MNGKRLAGVWLQLAGAIKQAWGDLTADPLRANAGRRQQINGKLQQVRGFEQEESARQLRDFQHHHRNWYS